MSKNNSTELGALRIVEELARIKRNELMADFAAREVQEKKAHDIQKAIERGFLRERNDMIISEERIRTYIGTAIDIQNANPDLLISGSLGLIFQGWIDARRVKDIDMCKEVSQTTIDRLKMDSEKHRAQSGPDLFSYSTSRSICEMSPTSLSTHKYDLFLMSKNVDPVDLLGSRFHKAEHIMAAKMEMNRRQDRIDHKSWNDGLIIRPFPFHLLPTFHSRYKEKED